MLLRKVNAWLSLATTILLFQHTIFYSFWMLSLCDFNSVNKITSRVLAGLMVLHAVLSIAMAFLGHKGADKGRFKDYPHINISTIIQRTSGILMLLLIGLHIWGAACFFQPKILHAFIQPLFFIMALAHASVSFSKAFITLGIGNAKIVKIIDITTKLLCLVIFILGVVGFYYCMFWRVF